MNDKKKFVLIVIGYSIAILGLITFLCFLLPILLELIVFTPYFGKIYMGLLQQAILLVLFMMFMFGLILLGIIGGIISLTVGLICEIKKYRQK